MNEFFEEIWTPDDDIEMTTEHFPIPSNFEYELPDLDGDIEICSDGFVAEIKSDEDFDKMMEFLFGK